MIEPEITPDLPKPTKQSNLAPLLPCVHGHVAKCGCKVDLTSPQAAEFTPRILFCPLHDAAPDLLAACKAMRAVLIELGMQDVDRWKYDKREAEIAAYRAIAKATGNLLDETA